METNPNIDNMMVAMVDYTDEWGDENDPASDWSQIQHYCCFSHKEACEFILHLGDDDETIKAYEVVLSEAMVEYCRQAQAQGYKYICFYS